MNQITYRFEDSDPLVPLSGRPVRSEVVRENFFVLSGASALWTYESDPPDLTIQISPGSYQVDPDAIVSYIGGASPTLDTTSGGVSGESRIAILSIDASQTLTWTYGTWTVGTPVADPFAVNEISICQVLTTHGMTEITYADITDVRPLVSLGSGTGAVGPQGVTGSGYVSELANDIVTGGSFSTASVSYVPIASASISTVGTATPIQGLFTFDIWSAIASATVDIRIVIDPTGVNDLGSAVSYEFQLANLITGGAAQHISAATFPAGTYNVQAQMRTSGSLVTIDNYQLSALGLEALQGETGIQGLPGAIVGDLDSAYTAGPMIDIDSGPVVLSNTSGGQTLNINKLETGTDNVLIISNAGTGHDIEGNSSNWFIDPNGDATFNGKLTVAGGIDPIYLQLNATTSTSVLDNAIYIDSGDSKLKFRNSGSAVAAVVTGGDGTPVLLNNTGASIALHVQQDATTDHSGIYVDNNGPFNGVSIESQNSSVGSAALKVNKQHSGSAHALLISNSGTGTGISLAQIGNGTGIDIGQSGINYGLQITKSATTGGAAFINTTSTANTNTALSIHHSGSGNCITCTPGNGSRGVYINKTNTGAGNCIDVLNSGSGLSIYVDSYAANTAARLIKRDTGNDVGLKIDNYGTGHGIQVDQNGAGVGIGVTIPSSSGVDAMQILNAGSGRSLYIGQTNTSSGSTGIHIANSGIGKDIVGNNWSIDSDGEGDFTKLITGSAINGIKMLSGRVTSAGAISDAGTGDWTVFRVSNGRYQLAWTNVFSTIPSTQATIIQTVANQWGTCTLEGEANSGCEIRTFPSGVINDRPFCFTVIGRI